MKNNPYVGPRPFERAERDRFFGRMRETRDLLALIMAERVVLLYGQSGAGKTSLLNTQIIPALEDEDFRVLPVARVGAQAPRGLTAAAIDNQFVFSALLSLAGDQAEPALLGQQTLTTFLQAYGVAELPPVVIFDQFEEIFTAHRTRWEDAHGFFQQLRDALATVPQLGVVLVLREEYLAKLDPYTVLLPRRLKARFHLEPLGYDGALEAIKKPAQNAGCAYGTGVAERLVDDLRRVQQTELEAGRASALGPCVEPVQLQVVCSRLWDSLPEREERVIVWPEIEQCSTVDRALTDFYDRAVAQTVSETAIREREVRRWFDQQLITPLQTRGLALRSEHETEGLPNAVVDVLEHFQLIRADWRAGAWWYELVHDRLIEPIGASNAAWEQAHQTPVRLAAQRWQRTGDVTLLYRDRLLGEAVAWANAHPAELEPEERDFLAASQQAQRIRQQLRRLRMTGLTLLGVSLLSFAVLGWLIYRLLAGTYRSQSVRDD